MKIKEPEAGRSMVEMLGVLAIIGVLSVGGIAGYSLSMRKHRANAIADIVSKYSLVVYNHCQKQLIENEVTSLLSCDNIPTFSEAGIGDLPSGVKSIENNSFSIDEDVLTTVYFSDTKLCQATNTITGTGCGSNGKQTQFKIRQN